MQKKFLVFSDLHITPMFYDTRVLKEISQIMMKSLPDYIVCTGDLGDFASQNRYVKDRGAFSVADEITAVANYIERYITEPVKKLQRKQRHDKKKMYKPRIVFCLGNHDSYVSDPLTHILNSLGIEVIQHRDFINLEGVLFSHTFDNGIAGTACTSTLQIIQNTLMRSVSGHSHVRSITEQRDSEGNKIFAIKLPCATMAEPDWAKQTSKKWDRGYLCLTVDTDSDWFQYTFREIHK